MKIKIIIFIFFIPILTRANEIVKRSLEATRTEVSIKVDGSLDEEAWVSSMLANNFTTLEPVPGLEPEFETEVRILYDDYAIYIGAFLIDPEPEKIMRQLTSRDDLGNASYFSVVLDPYQSGINGFGFTVTSAGVQSDYSISARGNDRNWDAVWKSSVKITEFGWIVEMEIPFSSIRFPDTQVQSWNINFGREARRTRERSFWNPIDPKINGFLNQAGTLYGIKDIKTPVRLMVSPYLSYGGNKNIKQKGGGGSSISGGADLKLGLNDAFTLDMTLIPDFSQVRFDEQVLNLSPFEVRFNENRAFFTEGTELFNKANLFYSRRIGGSPLHLRRVGELQNKGYKVTNYSPETQLINASKVSGRTQNGLGIGVFNAVVGQSKASFINEDGLEEFIDINPYTNYNVTVADQQLKNNSYLSFINTNVWRFGEDYDANVTGTEFSFRNKSQSYQLSGSAAVSQKYYADHAELGAFYNIEGNKTSGNFVYGLEYNEESPNYDINDLGFIRSNNERSIRARGAYNNFNPQHKNLNRYRIDFSTNYNRLVNPNVFTDFSMNVGGFIRTSNFIGTGASMRIEPIQTFDYFEPRTSDFSQKYAFPKNILFRSFMSTNYNNPLAIDVNGYYRVFNEVGRHSASFSFSPRWRISDRLNVRWSYGFTQSNNDVGFVTNATPVSEVENPVIFGIRDRSTMENSLNAQIIFNENMFINFIGRHYWSKVNYNDYHLLGSEGQLIGFPLDDIDDIGRKKYDQNYNFLNMDLVYNWRFAPGSDLIFVVKNYANNGLDTQDLRTDYFDSLRSAYLFENNFSINLKVTYFLDYYRLVNNGRA